MMYVSIYSWSCSFCGFGQMGNGTCPSLQYRGEAFRSPENPLCSAYSLLPLDLGQLLICFFHCFHSFAIPEYNIGGIIQYEAFHIGILRVFSCLDRSFHLSAEPHSLVWMDHVLFIHSLAEGPLGCSWVTARMNKAATNIHMQDFAGT